jgi:hypothetical protein
MLTIRKLPDKDYETLKFEKKSQVSAKRGKIAVDCPGRIKWVSEWCVAGGGVDQRGCEHRRQVLAYESHQGAHEQSHEERPEQELVARQLPQSCGSRSGREVAAQDAVPFVQSRPDKKYSCSQVAGANQRLVRPAIGRL